LALLRAKICGILHVTLGGASALLQLDRFLDRWSRDGTEAIPIVQVAPPPATPSALS
jgi:hypothetical protein